MTQLKGTYIGTPGSWGNRGNTGLSALTGTGFFDAPTSDDNWIGLDLGQAEFINQVTFGPRPGKSDRLIGGQFQGSNDQKTWETFYTISAAVAVASIPSPNGPYRYVRYLGPKGSYCNIAHVQFFGQPPVANPTAATPFVFAESPIFGCIDGRNSTQPGWAPKNGNVSVNCRPCLPPGMDWRENLPTVSATGVASFSPSPVDGANVSFYWETPGTYTISVTINGTTNTYPITINPTPQTTVYVDAVHGLDTNKGDSPTTAIKTIPDNPVSNHCYNLFAGQTHSTTPNKAIAFNQRQNVTLQKYGTGDDPIIMANGIAITSFWTDSADIILKNLRFESPDKVPERAGVIRGENITLIGITLGRLAQGFVDINSGTTANTKGLSIYGSKQSGVIGGPNYLWMDVVDLFMDDITMTGSQGESPFRCTKGDRGIQRGTIRRINLAQDDAGHKADATIRQATDLFMDQVNCKVCSFSVNKETDVDTAITRFWMRNFSINHSKLEIKPATKDAKFTQGDIDATGSGGECISYEAGPGVPVHIDNVVGTGETVFIKFNSDYDASLKVTNCTWNPTKPGNPPVKNRQGIALPAFTIK